MHMNQTKQSTFERVILSRWFLFLLFIIAVMVAIGYARAYYEDYQVRQEVQALQNEVNKLEKKKFTSLELLNYVKSDASVEEKARVEFNLKKPGENILVMPNSDSHQPTRGVTSTHGHVDDQPLSNIKKWWYYFIQ